MPIAKSVVEKDHRLEKTATRSRLELARHRWHWTLDETNPKRVSLREYARQVERSFTAVRSLATGYAGWRSARADHSEFDDFYIRAHISGDSLTATEAVATAKGISIGSASRHHAQEVREVKAAAQERAERKGTTVEEEAAEVATGRQKVRQSETNRREEKRAAQSVRYVQAEGKIAVAMRNLRALLDDTEGVEFTADERDLLAEALNRLRALLNLLDVRIIGTTDIDWDDEMTKLTGGQ